MSNFNISLRAIDDIDDGPNENTGNNDDEPTQNPGENDNYDEHNTNEYDHTNEGPESNTEDNTTETPEENNAENHEEPSDNSPQDSSAVQPTPNTEQNISVPDTGLFSHNSSSIQNSPLFYGIILVIVLSVIAIITLSKRHFKTCFKNNGFSINAKKKKCFITSIALLSILSLGNILSSNIQKTETSSAASNNTLTISTKDINLRINRETNKPAFGFVQDDITIVDGTDNGYTLWAYASNTDMISTSDETNKISVTNTDFAALNPNTWGISLDTPVSQNSETWNSMPTTQKDALIIKATDSNTTDHDTTSVYYGAFIDANLPNGTYSGVSINYLAIANIVIPDSFTLSFNPNNGTNTPDNQVCTLTGTNTACSITIPSTTPTRNGYTFLGWAETNSATTAEHQAGSTIYLSGNKILYAVWQLNTTTYSLSFAANGGTGTPDAQSCTAKGVATYCSVTIPSTKPSRSGFTFLGYADTADAVAAKYEINSTINLDSNKTIYALWKEETVTSTFTLSFNANNGTNAPDSQTCTTTTDSCSITISFTQPNRTNYTFAGWATKPSATVANFDNSNATITLTKDTVLYAVWKNNYTIKFNGNDSTNGSMTNLSMVYGETKRLPANTFTKEGYKFSGWNTKADGKGTYYKDETTVSNLTTVAGGTITLFAQWQSETGKIHFINTGGSNAFLIESNGHYGLIDSSNPLYPQNNQDDTTCMSESTCVSNLNQTVQQVVNYLDEIGVNTLDFVIASHAHSDHIGGMPVIARHYVNSNTKYYYRQYVTTKDDTRFDWHNEDYYNRAINAMRNAGATLVEVTNKEPVFNLGDLGIKLLNTEPASGNELIDGVASSENLNSIVILVSVGNKKVLFASDMHMEDEAKIANKVGAVDILQMGHHGNTTSSSEYFIQTTQPKEIILSAASVNNNKQFSAIVYAYKNFNSNFYLTGGAQKAVITTLKNNAYSMSYVNEDTTTAKITISTKKSTSGEWFRISNKSHGTKWVHFDTASQKLDTGWKWLESEGSTSKYFFDEKSGAMYTGWKKDNNGYWYYLDSDGRMVANDWKKIDDDWYYFDSDGKMIAESWQRINGSWYYFESNGKMVASKWKKITYQGKLQWFYFQANGKMVTGVQSINNEEYTFNSNGVCIQGRGCPLTP